LGELREPKRTRHTGERIHRGVDRPGVKEAAADAAVVELCWRHRFGESACTDQALDIQVAKVALSREY
jgi:hypothetical protein